MRLSFDSSELQLFDLQLVGEESGALLEDDHAEDLHIIGQIARAFHER